MSPAPKKCKAWQSSAWFTALQAARDEITALKTEVEKQKQRVEYFRDAIRYDVD
jgi:HAMP domain-containing protein